MFFEFLDINSTDKDYAVFVIMSKSLAGVKSSESWINMLIPPSLDHFCEMDSYVDEYLCIVAVGKANFHCFCHRTKFQLNIEL